MREILFRGKNFDNGVWIQGYYVRLNGNKHFIYTGQSDVDCGNYYPDYYPVAAKTVGQFTGLTTQNGKIFEGDIVIGYDVWGKEYGRGVVAWNETCSGWYYDNFKGMYSDGISIYKVIGNIHDNPELIGGADNGL